MMRLTGQQSVVEQALWINSERDKSFTEEKNSVRKKD